MEEGQVDDLASRIMDYLEDQEMDDAICTSFYQAAARWKNRDDNEDNGMDVA